MTTHLRLISAFVAAGLVLGIASCGSDDDDVTASDTSPPGDTTTVPDTPTTIEPPASDPLPLGAPLPDGVGLGWLGLSKADAEARAAEDGVTLRIVREDDETFALTDDLQEGRVNASIDDGVVTFVTVEHLDGATEAEGAEDPADLPYVGLTEEEAGTQADEAGTPWRVVSIDGEGQAVTMDFNPDRLNFDIVDGIVVAVTRG